MPLGTRYTRVERAHGTPEEIQTTPPSMEFHNNIESAQPLNPRVSSYNYSKPAASYDYMERPSLATPDSSTDLPTYEPYGNQYGEERPQRPPQRRTGKSFLSSISSTFLKTENGVSHFRIPKIAAPWEHTAHFSEKSGLGSNEPSSTIREFDHRRQRRRLFVNSSFRLLTTAFLCALLAAILYAFSTIRTGMTQSQKRGFNALITGVSIVVGLNLSSSLKGYANMMRWRFLAAGYRSLQDFELVMQCESQQAVFRLLWAGRTRGKIHPNKTQILAAVWLTINMALQIVTALLGLTYSIDISDLYVGEKSGNITIAKLDIITSSTAGVAGASDVNAQGALAQNYGDAGTDYPLYTSVFGSYDGAQQSIFTNDAEDMYWYTFIDQGPEDPEGIKTPETVISTRQVSSTATCRDYTVLSGGYAGFDVEGNTLVTIQLDDGSNSSFTVDPQTQAGTTWMVNPDPDDKAVGESVCGPRCARVWALQVADNSTDPAYIPAVPKPRFWTCENTVSHVTNIDQYGSAKIFDLPDLQAWILAGAIGYSGSSVQEGDNDPHLMQSVMYPSYTIWAPPGDITSLEMAGRVMMFTTGAISAMDFNNPNRTTVQNQQQPIPAQVVNVQWNWACVVLGVIPLTQAVVLFLVVGFANKAVIKDDSVLSTARLLRPIVNRLGDKGCLLTGDEIAEELGNFKVVYGPRMPRGTPKGQEGEVVKHMDVIAEEEDIERWHGRMPAGRYDGMSTWNESDKKDSGEMELLIKDEREDEQEKVVERRRPVIKRRMSL